MRSDVSGDGSEFDHLFKDGERFKVGTIDAEVIYTPGSHAGLRVLQDR